MNALDTARYNHVQGKEKQKNKIITARIDTRILNLSLTDSLRPHRHNKNGQAFRTGGACSRSHKRMSRPFALGNPFLFTIDSVKCPIRGFNSSGSQTRNI